VTGRRVRAVVVDDSTTARTLLVSLLGADPEVEVVGEAADGADALAVIRATRPSIVLMDIEMPGVDGFEATKAIMAEVPTPIVIVTSRHDPRDVAVSLQATRLGALTVLPKPPGPSAPGFEAEAARFLALIKALSEVHVVRRRGRARDESPPTERVGPGIGRDGPAIRIVGVGASTGGPAALFRFLGALPGDLTIPVVVVQHIAPGFVEGLVRWLNSGTPLHVRLARQGETLAPGHVYVAPDGTHLQVNGDGTAALDDGEPLGGFRPAASVLFSSLGRSFGPASAAVVLTGMGVDGLEGARELRTRGGLVLAQDEDTSTVFGMPRAVADAGLAHDVGPVEELAFKVAALAPILPNRRWERS